MSTLFVEAFGQLLPHGELRGIDVEEEDLYSVFNSRAEMMLWSTTAMPRPAHALPWEMNEAELEADPGGRIGYAQVGTRWDIVEILVPLLQCFDDALRRFGDVELTGLQVTAGGLDPALRPGMSESNWFNNRRGQEVTALATCSEGMFSGGDAADFAVSLSRWNGIFKYGTPVRAPDEGLVAALAEAPFIPVSPCLDGLAVSVLMPEWTASAAAWVFATVINAAHTGNSGVRDLAIRLTRAERGL